MPLPQVVCNLQNEREKLRQRARVQKARNLGNTANKDAVHQLVTQSLQGLTIGGGGAGGTTTSTNGMNNPIDTLDDPNVASVSRAPSTLGGTGGTIGRSTLGQRSGRKWEETLEAGEQKLRKEQEHLAAFSREKLQADTFAPPPPPSSSIEGVVHTDDLTSGEFASSSASPPAAATSNTPNATQPAGGEKKYVARFVSRRGRGTLGKNECLCTQILVHKDCAQHGEQASRLLASQDNETNIE